MSVITMLAALTLGGCGSSPTPEAPAPAPARTAESSIPADGERYAPPIDKADVPDGAWMCDMGTVHYAAPHAGECPVCGMKLVEKK